jgi:hypothetical protein
VPNLFLRLLTHFFVFFSTSPVGSSSMGTCFAFLRTRASFVLLLVPETS